MQIQISAGAWQETSVSGGKSSPYHRNTLGPIAMWQQYIQGSWWMATDTGFHVGEGGLWQTEQHYFPKGQLQQISAVAVSSSDFSRQAIGSHVKPTALEFSLLLFYLFERDRERGGWEKERSITWFTLQIPAIGRAGPGQELEPGTQVQSRFLTWGQELSYWSHWTCSEEQGLGIKHRNSHVGHACINC